MPSALDGLTDAQRDAVTHRGTPLLVVGGPGTGKSEVLVRRVAHLAEAAGVEPHRTLVLSAAPAAAAIRVRIEDALASAHEELAVHTAPTLAARILAERGGDARHRPVRRRRRRGRSAGDADGALRRSSISRATTSAVARSRCSRA